MAFNLSEDALIPGGVVLLLFAAVLGVYGEVSDNKVGSAKQLSELHRTAITAYWDGCSKPHEKSLEECANDAVALAIANGYASKLPKILKDAGFDLSKDQLSRLAN